tara:strand:- start:982 stop:1194 length:213 start_codon:yes stop_codon:yes gene_type:complete
MKVKELNDILIYCKVNELYRIEYIDAIGDLQPINSSLQEYMQLYCHKFKKFVSVKDIITKAKKHGYEGLG